MNISSSATFAHERSSTAGLRPASLNAPTPPQKLREAGRQFEALLITQLLQSARSNGAGWLGAPEDSTSDCATDFAEQQFAEALASSGGLGIARMIETSLREPAPPPEPSAPAPAT